MIDILPWEIAQFSQIIFYIGVLFIAIGSLGLVSLKNLAIKLFIYSALLLVVGILGVIAPATTLLFKIIAAIAIIIAIILILANFIKFLIPIALPLLTISPFFFPMITGGLIAVGSDSWLLSLILSLIALLLLRSFYSDLFNIIKKAIEEMERPQFKF